MNNSRQDEKSVPEPRSGVWQAFGWLASTQLAVVLMLVIAAILGEATLVERSHGREYVQWYVYRNPWFVSLLGLFALNILAAMLIRFPWRWRQVWFLLAHVGILTVLVGAMMTFSNGIDGRMVLTEGQSGQEIVVADNNELSLWRKSGKPAAACYFDAGPSDWPDGTTLDLGKPGGVRLEVLKFYRHARVQEEWVADTASPPVGSAALLLALAGPDGASLSEQWLVANPFAPETFVGPMRLTFEKAAAPAMLDDFVNPPSKGADTDGILSMHYKGAMIRIPVRENIGKKVPAGKDKDAPQVEISAYYPDAKAVGNAKFATAGPKANNPMLDLKIHVPGAKAPMRQIAFARNPLLNLDGMHGGPRPVKFWYHHPAVVKEPGTQFLETPDGTLHYRTIADGLVVKHGEAKEGVQIAGGEQLHITILRSLPHARQKSTFVPVHGKGEEAEALEAAVQVRATVGDKQSVVWLLRDDETRGYQQIDTPDGPIEILFRNERVPLGFSLKLVSFEHKLNPGMMGDADFGSKLEIINPHDKKQVAAKIAMNEPLVYGGFSFYQSGGQDDAGDGHGYSLLAVAHDPGIYLKNIGCILVCVGVFGTFYGRALFAWLASLFGATPRVGVVLLAFGLLGATSVAADTKTATVSAVVDCRSWQSLPVQDGGRQKPFDTLAAETLRFVTGKSSFADPQSHRTLDPIEMYLALLFSGDGWDRKAGHHAMAGGDGCPVQGGAPTSDAWDREPLIPVDYEPLRTALNLPVGVKHISFVDLGRAMIQPGKDGEKMLFLVWAKQVSRIDPRSLEHSEKKLREKGVELAERYYTYQDVRRGRQLDILPVADSKARAWISAAELAQTKWDDKRDPTGDIRKAKVSLEKVRAAYQSGDSSAFRAASDALLASLRNAGPKLGEYPATSIIDAEVTYNHWVPFRVAWICMALALLGMMAALAFGNRPLYWAGLAFYLASIAAMLAAFTLRTVISERAPVTNMYESVVFVAFGAALFGLIYGLVGRKGHILVLAAAVAAIVLILAENCPTILDPAIRPLTPILRSNYWLAVHVMTIMLSYAAFAVAMLVGNVALGFHLAGSAETTTVADLNKFMLQLLRAGVLLLILGTYLGAAWADNAWGRFWGWDPKEVWALITLLGYCALLHAKRVGWTRDFGLAAFSVLCFMLLFMAWYGVNYWLGTGLHSYGFGGGGQGYVMLALAVQFAYVGAATLFSARSAPQGI